MTDDIQPSIYPRDMVGYGRNVPHAQWPLPTYREMLFIK